jgi:hypothetical protein
MAKQPARPFDCPVCGEEVPAGAKSCPECGACEKSGWNPHGSDGLDLADDDFDYDEFVSNEFGNGSQKSKTKWIWVIAAALLLVAFALVGFQIGAK